jgi:hypothetical protein
MLVTCITVFGQDVSELDRRNGFKSILLGSPIDSVKNAEYKKDIIERKEFAAKVYETDHPDYKTIGEVPVKKVQLNTYNGLIYEIHVYLHKDPRVMQGLEKAFGAATHSMRMNAYYWKSEKLSLIYEGEGKQIHLTYRSAPIIRMMYADKNKKVDDVSQDF